jgi:hypothetical protein
MSNEYKIEVRGIRELQRAFKAIDAELPKELRQGFLGIAQRVAANASGRVPRVSGRAAGSIKPRASQRGAGIAFSDVGGSVPYFPWLNFGGRVGRNNSIERERVTPDRYIYTAIGAMKDETREAAEKAVTDAAHNAGFETRIG